jgi:predicted RNA-binding Zn-ribbon protein involved in translation (DUF1610 family)
MGFTFEQDCSQCGAIIELDETDHLVRCPYCNVKSFLFTPNYFRFVLPHNARDREIIYAPYLRFKGNVYYCMGSRIGHRVVDITHAGLPLEGIPVSLGLRPQAMKMKLVTPDTNGSFLRFSLKPSNILTRAGKLAAAAASGELFHRAYIGETMSIIYLPLYLDRNRVFDAILNKPILKVPASEDFTGKSINRNPRWHVTFLPTLCPQCGWNLDGEKDSVVLICTNCETAWEAADGRFVRVNFQGIPGDDENTVYLAFWKICVSAQGLELDSFADFIRLTNQPRLVRPEMDYQEMSFWAPAFKIRPGVFLSLSRRFTISQHKFQTDDLMPKKNRYPVTLPQREAVQSMKITLASSSINKKDVLPQLPRLRFNMKRSSLVYLPFTIKGHEMIQQQMDVSINKNALEFGRRL